MADQTQYFDFSSAQDPFHGLSDSAIASLVPQSPGQLRVDLMSDECTVGRTDETDIVIAHRNVSKNHARLRRDGTMWELEDIGSTNGTFVNGQKVTGSVLISHTDKIGFGDQTYEFVVHELRQKAAPEIPKSETGESPSVDQAAGGGMTAMFGSLFEGSPDQGGAQQAAAASPAPAAAPPSGGAPMAAPAPDAGGGGDAKTMLRSYDFSAAASEKVVYAALIEKSLSSSRIDLTELRNRIGSAITNEVQIQDRSVRPEHAELTFEKDGRVKVRVLENDIIIKVNGEPVKAQYLNDLDTLQVGEIIYTFKLEQVPELADFEAMVDHASSGGGKGKMVAIIIVLLAVVGGGGYMMMGGGGKAAGGPGGGSTAAAVPTVPPLQEKSQYDVVKAHFDKGQLVEARDKINELNDSDERVKELKIAINVLIDAQSALDKRDVVAAAREMAMLKGNKFENDSRVEKLRESVEFQQQQEATDAYDRAVREYRGERYADAQRYFERADAFLPGYKDAVAQALASRLSNVSSKSLKEAETYIVTREYTEAEKILETALADIEANRLDAANSGKISEHQAKLGDYLNFSRMKRNYLEGKARDALAAASRISDEEFRVKQRVDNYAEKIAEVSKLAQEAATEGSLAKADRVLQLETDKGNYYYQEATKIVADLSEVQREKAQSLYDQGMDHNEQEDRIRALAAFWRARQLDPTWEEARRAHDETGSKLLVQAYRLPGTGEFREQKEEIYRWIMENAQEGDKIYLQAKRQLKLIEQ